MINLYLIQKTIRTTLKIYLLLVFFFKLKYIKKHIILWFLIQILDLNYGAIIIIVIFVILHFIRIGIDLFCIKFIWSF